jgi:hypothetical protein
MNPNLSLLRIFLAKKLIKKEEPCQQYFSDFRVEFKIVQGGLGSWRDTQNYFRTAGFSPSTATCE